MVITHLEQVTAGWLTGCLRASGALQSGEVTAFRFESGTFNRGQVSDVYPLRPIYSPGASGDLPERLLLKLPRSDLHPELRLRGRHEADFYRRLPSAVTGFPVTACTASTGFPVAACYASAVDEETNLCHILMKDYSATHFQKPVPIPPSDRHCAGIMRGLACLHAAWWNDPRLGTEIGERLTPEKASAIEQRLVATLPAFFDFLGDALLPHQRLTIERIIASDFMARRAQRLCDLRRVTLIHGDAHTGNLLLPRDDPDGQVILIDWQLWGIDIPTFDLAFLMGLHWSPQRRILLELPLLRIYHELLQSMGVEYGWSDLWTDYREAIIVMCLIPIGQFRRGSPPGVVWFGLQDSLSAFLDLRCEELL